MTNYESAKLARNERLDAFYEERESVVSVNTKLQEAFVAFKANNVKIRVKAAESMTSTKGYTREKLETREALTEELYDVTLIGGAYAASKDDDVLEQAMTVTRSELIYMAENEFVNKAQFILNTAGAIATELQPWGLSADKLADAVALLEEYKTQKPLPKEIEAIVRRLEGEIDDLMADNELLLTKQIVKLIKLFRSTNPEVADEFTSLNKIDKPPVSHTRVTAVYTTRAGAPVANYTLKLNNATTTVEFTANEEGTVFHARVPFGMYNGTVEKDGAVLAEIRDLKVTRGKVTRIEGVVG